MRNLLNSSKGILIGSQVAAPWQDGVFYPGVVRSITNREMGDTVYTVEFNDRYIKDFTGRQIVGCNFNMKEIHLKFNQKVYVTHNNTEVCGFVQKHRKQTNEVFIKLDDSEETLVRRKLEEVRLLSSINTSHIPGSEYYRLNTPSEGAGWKKKRTVTDGVDVPSAKTLKTTKEEEPEMNEVMAAMILTSLQTASPSIQQYTSMDCTGPMSPGSDASSSNEYSSPSPTASSGHFSWDLQSRGTPSPGLSISDAESYSSGPMTIFSYVPQGTPVESMPGALMFSSSIDEGIDLGENGSSIFWDDPARNAKRVKAPSKTLYKCRWQRCMKTLCTVQGIERHIRTVHLGKKDNDFSDHEEEFYYTEVEPTMETFSDSFASMMASSPPPFQPDNNGNVVPQNPRIYNNHSSPGTAMRAFSPSHTFKVQLKCNTNQSTLHQSPNSISPTIPNTLYHHGHNKKFEADDVHQMQTMQPLKQYHISGSPNKTHLQLAGLTCSTKIRAEGRKCRKVYGMDNKKLWCTQCKWKKACVRFL